MTIIEFLLTKNQVSDVNYAADELETFLRSLLDKHAPIVSRSMTLRPNAPWFNSSLHESKRKKRQCERKYLSTRLEIHRQIYRDQCSLYLSHWLNSSLSIFPRN